MDERRMTNEQRERERRRKAAAARKAASRYEDPGVGYQRRRRARKRRRRVRNVCIALLVIFIVVIGLAGGTIYWIKYGPTKETYDLNKYFGITAKSQMGVTINNEVLDAQAITEGGTAYLSYNFVQDYISDRFYWDSNEHMLLYTLPRDMVKAAADSKDYSVSDTVNSEDYTIVKTEGDTAYIALDFLQKYANFDYEVYKDPARVVITSKFGERQTAKVKDDSQVRILGGVKSPVLEEVKKGDKLTVLEDVSDWKKVCTKSGVVGYIQKSKLKDAKKETISREFEEPDYTGIKKDYKINLVWHQVTSEAANEGIEDALAATKGLNTISPTWFSVTDNSGNISSIASTDYVDYAHQCGLEVWALVDNFDQNVDDMELLSHTSSRENLENQLVNAALQNGIDGINVDFEQIPTDVGDHYIQFIRELSVLCRVNNLVLILRTAYLLLEFLSAGSLFRTVSTQIPVAEKENNKVQKGCDDHDPYDQTALHCVYRKQNHIQNCKPLHLDRDNAVKQKLIIRHDGCTCKENGHIDIVSTVKASKSGNASDQSIHNKSSNNCK